MTPPDLQALRALAQARLDSYGLLQKDESLADNFTRCQRQVREFLEAMTPEVVLVLLDRVEQLEADNKLLSSLWGCDLSELLANATAADERDALQAKLSAAYDERDNIRHHLANAIHRASAAEARLASAEGVVAAARVLMEGHRLAHIDGYHKTDEALHKHDAASAQGRAGEGGEKL